ncbi:hypothetical protein EV421DRAFT_1966328 [Armillaria borealis]|uniref:Uncharacterized protein n=1 Tax=Armillaria borealis TaxID=47425 RepID=A0AA39JD69_9AGAR|nr:hypothetical protein EV421DRAFT_1966328 [Armillaria borealis]
MAISTSKLRSKRSFRVSFYRHVDSADSWGAPKVEGIAVRADMKLVRRGQDAKRGLVFHFARKFESQAGTNLDGDEGDFVEQVVAEIDDDDAEFPRREESSLRPNNSRIMSQGIETVAGLLIVAQSDRAHHSRLVVDYRSCGTSRVSVDGKHPAFSSTSLRLRVPVIFPFLFTCLRARPLSISSYAPHPQVRAPWLTPVYGFLTTKRRICPSPSSPSSGFHYSTKKVGISY